MHLQIKNTHTAAFISARTKQTNRRERFKRRRETMQINEEPKGKNTTDGMLRIDRFVWEGAGLKIVVIKISDKNRQNDWPAASGM